jgi:hypothetical protein
MNNKNGTVAESMGKRRKRQTVPFLKSNQPVYTDYGNRRRNDYVNNVIGVFTVVDKLETSAVRVLDDNNYEHGAANTIDESIMKRKYGNLKAFMFYKNIICKILHRKPDILHSTTRSSVYCSRVVLHIVLLRCYNINHRDHSHLCILLSKVSTMGVGAKRRPLQTNCSINCWRQRHIARTTGHTDSLDHKYANND